MAPVTRSHNQLDALSKIIFSDESTKNILFITGAGISEASGVPLYRSQKDATAKSDSVVWNRFVEEWCTIEAFLRDPEQWYLQFWDTTHNTPAVRDAEPNEAHLILAKLTRLFPERIRIITQNVDRLHIKAGTPQENLIEVHGHLGLYRCVDSRKTCIKSWSEPITEEELTESASGAGNNLKLCPVCQTPCMPMLLTFSDSYNAHSFFGWNKAKQLMLLADVTVFIGTSFSVTLTDFSLLCCQVKNNSLVYSINTCASTELIYNYTEKQEDRVSTMWNELMQLLRNYGGSDPLFTFNDFDDCSTLEKWCEERLTDAFQRPKRVSGIAKREPEDTQGKVANVTEVSSLRNKIDYLLSRSLWETLDFSDKDQIVNTARYNKVCRIVKTATECLLSLHPPEYRFAGTYYKRE